MIRIEQGEIQPNGAEQKPLRHIGDFSEDTTSIIEETGEVVDVFLREVPLESARKSRRKHRKTNTHATVTADFLKGRERLIGVGSEEKMDFGPTSREFVLTAKNEFSSRQFIDHSTYVVVSQIPDPEYTV
jgi:hypothetical protein